MTPIVHSCTALCFSNVLFCVVSFSHVKPYIMSKPKTACIGVSYPWLGWYSDKLITTCRSLFHSPPESELQASRSISLCMCGEYSLTQQLELVHLQKQLYNMFECFGWHASQMAPASRQRFYSIASAPKVAPGEVHICVSRLTYKINSGMVRQVCMVDSVQVKDVLLDH